MKYVSKSGDAPDWILGRTMVRIFQTSRGFLLPGPKSRPQIKEGLEDTKPTAPVQRCTLGERLEHYKRTVVLEREFRIHPFPLHLPFSEIFDHVVLPAAKDGRYLGNRRIETIDREEVILWVTAKKVTDLNDSPIYRQAS